MDMYMGGTQKPVTAVHHNDFSGAGLQNGINEQSYLFVSREVIEAQGGPKATQACGGRLQASFGHFYSQPAGQAASQAANQRGVRRPCAGVRRPPNFQ